MEIILEYVRVCNVLLNKNEGKVNHDSEPNVLVLRTCEHFDRVITELLAEEESKATITDSIDSALAKLSSPRHKYSTMILSNDLSSISGATFIIHLIKHAILPEKVILLKPHAQPSDLDFELVKRKCDFVEILELPLDKEAFS